MTVLIKRSFQGLSGAIKAVRIVEELIEIWPNEVCDKIDDVSTTLRSSQNLM